MPERDERRALLARHGYPPDLPPRGVTGPPGEIVNGYKSQAGQIVPARLRNWVCTLEGVIIDGHSDQDNTGLCVLCGRETTEDRRGTAVAECPCGEVHELSAATRAAYEDVTGRLSPDVLVSAPGGSWRVPRIFIAVHGLKAADLTALAERYGFAAAEENDG